MIKIINNKVYEPFLPNSEYQKRYYMENKKKTIVYRLVDDLVESLGQE